MLITNSNSHSFFLFFELFGNLGELVFFGVFNIIINYYNVMEIQTLGN
jgi:hypothetical protein